MKDIGLRSDCNDFGGLNFGAGIVLACFQTCGTNPSRTDALKIVHNGPEMNFTPEPSQFLQVNRRK